MSLDLLDLVSIRQLELNDLHFVLDSFTACLSNYTESIVKGYTEDHSHKILEKQILTALNDSRYSMFVCCLKDDSENIIGFAIADPSQNHLFFSYTKYSYRRLGIQKNLLLPLLLDFDSKITVNWPTKEMLRLKKQGRIEIRNRFLEDLLDTVKEKRDEDNQNIQ